MKLAGAAAVIAAALVLAGCSQTVSGTGLRGNAPSGAPSQGPGTSGPPPQTSSSSAPESSAPPAAHLACPHVVDSSANLAYDCIVAGMTNSTTSTWPVKFEKEVDVQWSMDEGSGRVDSSQSPAAVAASLTSSMAAADYGPHAGVKKEQDADTTVDGKKAHLVQTLMTIDPTYRKQRHLKVTQERLWIVAVQVSADQVSAWYVSVPSVQKALWPRVPNLIKSLKVV